MSALSGSDALRDLLHDHPQLVRAARVGWVAKGLVYLLVGALAVPVAMERRRAESSDSGSDEASQKGAIERIAESGAGQLVLWMVAAGLLLYVIWRIVTIFLPARNEVSAWATRAGYALSVVVYSGLAWSTISYARGTTTTTSDGSEDALVERYTRDLMDATGGRWLVAVLGVVVMAIGVAFVHRGATAAFQRELEPRGVGPISHQTIVGLGRAGWIGRGIMMVIVGWFIAQAALHFDPSEAQGLDGALRNATESTLGALLAGVVAVGLILYGAFCIVSAPRERLVGAG